MATSSEAWRCLWTTVTCGGAANNSRHPCQRSSRSRGATDMVSVERTAAESVVVGWCCQASCVTCNNGGIGAKDPDDENAQEYFMSRNDKELRRHPYGAVLVQ